MIESNFYELLENEFNVIYPGNSSATYSSLLNFSSEKDTFRQRWYIYKEGYSSQLVEKIIKDYNKYTDAIILDPFLGSGSTIMAANKLSLKGIGFEVNPFSYFLSKMKLQNYSEDTLIEFQKASEDVFKNINLDKFEYQTLLPKLSIADKVFSNDVGPYFMAIKYNIDNYLGSMEVKQLLKLGWLSALEEVSLYKKSGNGLKKRTSQKTIVTSIAQVEKILRRRFLNIENDMITDQIKFDCKVINDSCLNISSYLEKESINGVIFSPPYANSFDYTEIYKLELWFGNFVDDYEDLKKLRKKSLRSHLNAFSDVSANHKIKLKELDILLDELKTKKLWNKKIPLMIEIYFEQMFSLLNELYSILKDDGFCTIIIGNSSYGGVIIPTDLLLAKYAKKIGFIVDKIEIDRFIITSSQQYIQTKNNKKYLRESVVCLRKIKR